MHPLLSKKGTKKKEVHVNVFGARITMKVMNIVKWYLSLIATKQHKYK
jgi:hypothetical protein